MTSSPPRPLSVRRSLACLLEEDVDRGLKPEDADPAGVARGAERVVALGAVDRDRVGRAVAAAVGPAQVEVDPRHVGAAQVADDDVVGAAQGPEVDALDVVEVHRDVGHVAGEADPPAVGRDVDVLGDVGAEEEHRVGAVLALDRVVAVARVPLEDVVAGADEGHVVAVVADDEVVAVAAEEHVGALRLPRSVSLPAPPSTVSLTMPAGSVDAVTPSLPPRALTTSAVVGPLGVGDVHQGRQPDHGDRGARAEDVDDVVAVGAVDDDGVGLRRRRCVPPSACQVDVDLGQVGAGEVVDGDRVGAAQGVEVDASRRR